MRRLAPLLVAFPLLLTACLGASASSAPASVNVSRCADAASWADAGGFIGQRKTFTGIVALVQRADGAATLGVYDPPVLQYFTATISMQARAAFPANLERAYLNRHVCVTGFVRQAAKGLTLEIDGPAAIDIIEGEGR